MPGCGSQAGAVDRPHVPHVPCMHLCCCTGRSTAPFSLYRLLQFVAATLPAARSPGGLASSARTHADGRTVASTHAYHTRLTGIAAEQPPFAASCCPCTSQLPPVPVRPAAMWWPGLLSLGASMGACPSLGARGSAHVVILHASEGVRNGRDAAGAVACCASLVGVAAAAAAAGCAARTTARTATWCCAPFGQRYSQQALCRGGRHLPGQPGSVLRSLPPAHRVVMHRGLMAQLPRPWKRRRRGAAAAGAALRQAATGEHRAGGASLSGSASLSS